MEPIVWKGLDQRVAFFGLGEIGVSTRKLDSLRDMIDEL